MEKDRKKNLDEISIDKSIVLRAYDGHTLWLNSKAFKEFSIDIDTLCPIGGKIEINEETNELWGILKESATHLIKEHNYSEEEYMKAFELFQRKMHKFGITSMLSMSGVKFGMSHNSYKRLFEEDKLKMRISNSMIIFSDEDIKSQIDEIKNIREKYDSDLFKITTIKLLADGVVEGSTAYLLEPYELGAGRGNNDFRNTIAHLQLVNNNDIKRFRELNIIAAVQSYWHIKGPKWWDEVDYKLLGDRSKYEYPLNYFIKEGVTITSSSYHSVTPEPNPFYAIEAGVTRKLYNSKYFGVEDINNIYDERYLLNKDERISAMVKSFTINGAHAIFRENEIGSIEVGKYADFIVIDRDIFNIYPIDIEKTNVLMIFFDGRIVYESKN